MKVICTGIACGNTECRHAVPHEPIEHGDGDCRETVWCPLANPPKYVRCGEVEEVRAEAARHLELVPA
jgi:hypothetical protein